MTGQSSGSSTFRVLNPRQPREVVDPAIGGIADNLAHAAAARTPVRTGTLRAGWQPVRVATAVYRVTNAVPYGHFVEFGTANMPAEPMLAPVMLAARARYER